MPTTVLLALRDQLAQGRFSQALAAVEAALEHEQAEDKGLLRRYRLLLLRQVGALPPVEIDSPGDEALPPADPEAPWLENERAWVLLHHQPTQALEFFRDLRRRAPSRLDVALGEAAALRSLQRFTEARSLIEGLGDQHGGRSDWKLSAARLDIDEDRFEQACDRLNEVIGEIAHHEGALHDKAMLLRNRDQQPEAQSVLDKHAGCCRGSILLHMPRGWLRYDESDWNGALREFGCVLAPGRRYPAAVVGKVMVLRRRNAAGDLRDAADLLSSADPDAIDPELAAQTGWLASDSGRYRDAEAAFDRALRAHPYLPDAVVGKMQALQQRGLDDDAEQMLIAATFAVPDSRRFKRQLGWLYVHSGNYAKAVECFAAIARENYQDADATQGLATAYHFSGRYDEAERELGRSLELNPHHAGLRNELGWIHILRGKYLEAIAEFDRALAVDRAFDGAVQGKFTALSHLDRYDEIHALLTDYETIRHDSATLHLMRGQTAFIQGRYDHALEEFQRVLLLYDRHIDALVGRVAALRTLGRLAESKVALTAAQRIFPDDTRLLTEEAWLHFDQGDYERALACFEHAGPTENALRGKAAVLRTRGEHGKARGLVDEALTYLPTSPPLLTERGWILFDEGRHVESCSAFDDVLKISGEHREARQGMVASLARLHEYEHAHQVLAAAIRHQADSPVFRVEEGYLLLEQDRLDEARVAFSQARELAPHDENAVIGESIALRRMNRHQEALRRLDEELACQGENPALRSERGWVLLEQGDAVASIMDFDRARASLRANDNAVLGSAVALRQLGRREEARQRLEQRIRPGVFDSALEAQLAWVNLESGRWDEATRIFRQLAERDHMYGVEARLGIAEVALRRGDRERAISDYEQLERDVPDSAIAKVRLATQLDDQKRARDLCLEATRLEPGLAIAYDRLGIISTWAGEFEAAEGYLRQSLNLDPSRPQGLIKLGWFYLQTSRLDAAGEHLSAALRKDPSDPDANILMGALHLRTGAIDQADLHFSRALCARRQDPVGIEGLARAMVARKDWSRAEEILRNGLDDLTEDHRRSLHLLLARVLIFRGDDTRSHHFYEEALTEARAAMGHPEIRAGTWHGTLARMRPPAPAMPESGDPWFLAAVASYRMSARSRAEGHAANSIPRRDRHERLAIHFLRAGLRHNPHHREAAHLLAQIDDERRLNLQALSQWSITIVAAALLATLWIAFLKSNRVSQNTLVILSPVLIGLLVIASLLPFLERFKLPGVEADVRSPSGELESPPPLSDVSLGDLAAESLSPGTDRTTLPTAPQAPGNMRRHSAAVFVSALAGKPAAPAQR